MEMERFSGSAGGRNEQGERRGEVRLPIGFRFRPTDEELLVHYLKRRALSVPLPASIIPEFDVFHSDPWDLPGDSREKKRFYFTRMMEKSVNNKCTHCKATTTSSGFWKAIGKPKHILAASFNNQQQQQIVYVVGTRKLWVFYQEQHSPHGWFRTNWFIHEFHLPNPTIPVMMQEENPNPGCGGNQIRQDWIACKVFQRKRKQQTRDGFLLADNKCIGNCSNSGMPSYIDFKSEEQKLELGPPEAEPSSPLSSSSIDHPMFS